MRRGTPCSVGVTISFTIVSAVVGMPLVAYLWETVKQLLTGTVDGRRVIISVPLLILFILLLVWLT